MMDKEPQRWYDWMGWKLRQEKKEKSIEDQIVGMGAGAGGRDISKEFQLPKPMSEKTDEVIKHLNRIEEKIDLLLIKKDGGLK
jgi:hypothetical protein